MGTRFSVFDLEAGLCLKHGTSGPTPDLLGQKQHFNKIPSEKQLPCMWSPLLTSLIIFLQLNWPPLHPSSTVILSQSEKLGISAFTLSLSSLLP